MRRISEAAMRAAERRLRENEAKRLSELVPELESLSIRVDERLHGNDETEVAHVRHVMVDIAPAMFAVPCCDRHCTGEHDLTHRILKGLRQGAERIEGRDECHGTSKAGDCHLELSFVASATYAA
jgi:hypothetical protein